MLFFSFTCTAGIFRKFKSTCQRNVFPVILAENSNQSLNSTVGIPRHNLLQNYNPTRNWNAFEKFNWRFSVPQHWNWSSINIKTMICACVPEDYIDWMKKMTPHFLSTEIYSKDAPKEKSKKKEKENLNLSSLCIDWEMKIITICKFPNALYFGRGHKGSMYTKYNK